MTIGRPSTYTLELAEAICLRIAEGESLVDIVKDDGMPAYSTVSRWRRDNETFRAMYAHAREDRADFEADEIKLLADEDARLVELKDNDGNVVDYKVDTAFEAWRKTRIDARKWLAAKHRPKVYGDRVELEHSGEVKGLALNVNLAPKAKEGE